MQEMWCLQDVPCIDLVALRKPHNGPLIELLYMQKF